MTLYLSGKLTGLLLLKIRFSPRRYYLKKSFALLLIRANVIIFTFRRLIMRVLKNNESGFTLVELMVVVAIIGILSAVAIPQFSKYQAKSKTSEAKLQLASVYTAQVAWNGDYDNYATCLGAMGVDAPTGNYYAIGFTTAGDGAADGGANLASETNGATSGSCDGGVPTVGDSRVAWYPASKIVGGVTMDTIGAFDTGVAVAAGPAIAAADVTADSSTFQAAALGYIDSANVAAATDASLFVINEEKVLLQRRQGY